MLTKQVVIIQGQRITEVGLEGSVSIPAGTRVIDLSHATVLPGFVDRIKGNKALGGVSDAKQSVYGIDPPGSGPGGRWFKSTRPDHSFQ